jgi:hypothetical protein
LNVLLEALAVASPELRKSDSMKTGKPTSTQFDSSNRTPMFDASAGLAVNGDLNLRPDLKEYSVARPADCSEFGEHRSWQLNGCAADFDRLFGS